MSQQTSILQAYTDFVLNNGKRPPSVKAFMDAIEMPEGAFYTEFASFPALEQFLFGTYLDTAIQKLEASKEYAEYGTPEKLAGLFYTWLGELLENRSFVVFLHHQEPNALFTPFYMESTATVFQEFTKNIIRDGIDDEEVADRWLAPRLYRQWLWGQARWLLRFWINDTSKNFEKTDEAVEKLLRFTYDIMRPNSLDSGWDVAKFLWRNR